MPCIDYGPNGTNIDECGSNRANEYSPRDEVSEDAKQRDEYYKKLAEENENDLSESIGTIKCMDRAAVDATELNLREHATQGKLFPKKLGYWTISKTPQYPGIVIWRFSAVIKSTE